MRKKKKMSAVITLILFCGCFLFGSFLSFAQNSRTEEPVQFKCYKSIVIQEGDSLWSLAERHIDSESETAVKEYIKELKQINQLESPVASEFSRLMKRQKIVREENMGESQGQESRTGIWKKKRFLRFSQNCR